MVFGSRQLVDVKIGDFFYLNNSEEIEGNYCMKMDANTFRVFSDPIGQVRICHETNIQVYIEVIRPHKWYGLKDAKEAIDALISEHPPRRIFMIKALRNCGNDQEAQLYLDRLKGYLSHPPLTLCD